MKLKCVFQISIFIFILFSTNLFCQERFSFGIKGGISIWKLLLIENEPVIRKGPFYSFPPGFSLGLFTEAKLSERFSIVNELSFQNRITKMTLHTGYLGILEQKLTSKFLDFPILLKYQTPFLWDTYFILGPNFSYLLKANYDFYDRIYLDKGNVEITKDLPALSTAISFGLGEKFKTPNFDVIVELRMHIGLSKFSYASGLGESRNLGLFFLMGAQL